MKPVLGFAEMQGAQSSRIELPSFNDIPKGWQDPSFKEQVVEYMASQKHLWMRSCNLAYTDIFTGETIPVNGNVFHDDEWRWIDEVIFYIDMYDLVVPTEFAAHVARAYESGFQPDIVLIPWR